jgi:hypothetical protein
MLRAWKRGAETEASERLGVRASKLTPATILDAVHGRLERSSNPRFGFSFLHPAVWDRSDPANGDGNTFRHPTDARISIRAWGGYAAVSADLSSWVAWSLGIDREKPGFQLLTDVFAGGKLVDWAFEQDNEPVKSTQQIEGRRIVFQTEEDGLSFISMQTFLQLNDTQVGLLCRVPTGSYANFEDLFLVVSKEIYMLGPNAAPFARTGQIGSRRGKSFWRNLVVRLGGGRWRSRGRCSGLRRRFGDDQEAGLTNFGRTQ